MKPHQTVQDAPDKVTPVPKSNPRQPVQREPESGAWQFTVLIVVIALGVLMMIGKVLGLF